MDGTKRVFDEDRSNYNAVATQTSKCTSHDMEIQVNFELQPFTEQAFVNDDFTKFYTGLPNFRILKAVFNHVEPSILTTGTKLSKFLEFILVLMKLRLNRQMQDLAYQFHVSVGTVSKIFLSG